MADDNPVIRVGRDVHGQVNSIETLRDVLQEGDLSVWAARMQLPDWFGGEDDASVIATLLNVRIVEHIAANGNAQVHEPASGVPRFTIHLLKLEGHYDLLVEDI